MSLYRRLGQLARDLDSLDGKATASMPMASAFNTLLEIAKNEHGDDPVIAAIKPIVAANTGAHSPSSVDIGTLRVLVGQVSSVVPDSI
jgi:hypothetical protein